MRLDSWALSLLLVPVEDRVSYEFVVRNADGCVALDASAREGTQQALQTLGISGISIEQEDAGDFEEAVRRLLSRLLEQVRPALSRQPPA